MRSASELIRHKRDGGVLELDEIRYFLSGVVDGSIPRYQAAALLMAIFFRGMADRELADLTTAMIDSGERLEIGSSGPKVDKHSTGGVGDKVSLCLAPLVAACGVVVPMMSGRGLGHTGGTLDKLESIPGFRTSFGAAEFARLVETNGVVIAGQSESVVPADRILYALRDTTATVASVPLISSSIMSKKLAERLDALVLDVKVGTGAFMESVDRARVLARTMVGIGESHGVRTTAFLTSMDQPLGYEVGNANEVAEAISVLRGGGPPDLTELVTVLGGAMLEAAGLDLAGARIRSALDSGAGLDLMRRMIEAQGGDGSVVDRPETLPAAARARRLRAERDGYVASIDARRIGVAAMQLGAGRRTMTDTVDHAAGITMSAKVGSAVARGDVLATLRFNDARNVEAAAARVSRAYTLAGRPPEERPLILEEVG
ncbi:MAG: thymidine phosphorylase [bacterium]|nr:thymidine phosphorylase [bacterium]MDE0289231.1 thymidine phosphorylase [bacterium]MDE0437130.1 thymidine phosphorylase [bacterium]